MPENIEQQRSVVLQPCARMTLAYDMSIETNLLPKRLVEERLLSIQHMGIDARRRWEAKFACDDMIRSVTEALGLE